MNREVETIQMKKIVKIKRLWVKEQNGRKSHLVVKRVKATIKFQDALLKLNGKDLDLDKGNGQEMRDEERNGIVHFTCSLFNRRVQIPFHSSVRIIHCFI